MTQSHTPRLRRILFTRLPGEAFDRVNWTALDRVMVRLRGLGWTADDVASQILGDYGLNGDPAALVVARAQNLTGPPPHDRTPTPPPAHQALHRADTPTTRAAEYLALIRAGMRNRA